MDQDTPVTGDDLAARWAERDDYYSRLRTPMDPSQAEAIRIGRRREAAMLPTKDDRARMWMRADTWQPPRHPEFGGLKEWLE